jgi:ribosomal-protein-alanine N-acetyltransferase
MTDRTDPFDGPQPTLHTARLVLRPFTADDAPDLRRYLSDAAVAGNTLTVPHPYPDAAADEFIAGLAPAWAARKRATWAVTRAGDGALVGAIGLKLTLAHKRAEVGYWIARPEWGNGYATEATRRLIAYAFDTLGLHRVEAHHFVENPASGRVLVNAGMTAEGVHRGVVWRDDRPRDLRSYAILSPDPR